VNRNDGSIGGCAVLPSVLGCLSYRHRTSHLAASIPGHTAHKHRSIIHASAAVFALLGMELSNDILLWGVFFSGFSQLRSEPRGGTGRGYVLHRHKHIRWRV